MCSLSGLRFVVHVLHSIEKSLALSQNSKYPLGQCPYLQNLKITYHTASMMQQLTELLSSCSFLESPRVLIGESLELWYDCLATGSPGQTDRTKNFCPVGNHSRFGPLITKAYTLHSFTVLIQEILSGFSKFRTPSLKGVKSME